MSPHDKGRPGTDGVESTDSMNSPLIIDDSPGDTTRWPFPPHIPLGWHPRPQWKERLRARAKPPCPPEEPPNGSSAGKS